MTYKIKAARGPLLLLLKMFGTHSWASLWGTLYVVPGYEGKTSTHSHGFCHLEQIESDGPILFCLVYLYWLFKFGYEDNPYEVEARLAEQG